VKYWIGALGALYLPISQAGVLEYGASLDQSVWKMATDTQLECRLEHVIPGWGKGAFVSHAGKNTNMDFELKPLRPQARIQTVTVRSMPPSWRPGVAESGISNVKFYKQFDGLVNGQAAWTMLDELEGGYTPSFLFRDWYHQNQPITVSVSAVGFRSTYQNFLGCMQTLLPYTFEDIAFTILNYEKNSDELTPYSKRRLAMISDYLKADPQIDLALVDAYSDANGSKSANQQLSEKRATSVKKFFTDLGVDSKRVKVEGHGEKQHVATNETERGRETNRRVVISIQRWTPPAFNMEKMAAR
jgi:outer membrane protein OmpA-like peptidoglycan-associated protein